LLIVMVVRQVVHDIQQGGPEARQEALRVLNDRPALATWTDLLALDADIFR
jgi:hypothetical protein